MSTADAAARRCSTFIDPLRSSSRPRFQIMKLLLAAHQRVGTKAQTIVNHASTQFRSHSSRSSRRRQAQPIITGLRTSRFCVRLYDRTDGQRAANWLEILKCHGTNFGT
jgi:hypothetical protein